MSCRTYFDASDLQSSSLETEIGWSSLCIPNVHKLAILLVLLFWSALTLAFCSYQTLMDFKRSSKWSLRRTLIMITNVGPFTQTILQILYLSGVQSRARYLLVPYANLSLFFTTALMLQLFIRVNAKVVTNAMTDSRLILIRKLNWGFIVSACTALILVCTVLPMALYDDPATLNPLYTCYVVLVMFCSILICCFFLITFHRLTLLLQPKADIPLTPSQAITLGKLQILVKLTAGFGIVSFLGLLFPIWIGLTATSGDPGMRGIFYYHFCFMLPYHLLGYPPVMFAILNAQTRSTSQSSSSVDRRKVGTGEDQVEKEGEIEDPGL